MSKEYYVSYANSDFFVHRPNGGLLTRAANEADAKYICAELNKLLHRIRAREEDELEPYRVGTGIDSQLLYCNNELFAEFKKTEDAKRVCALLNAEHRKEQSNG